VLDYAISLTDGARLTTLTNNGTISATNFNGVYVNASTITTLSNTGTISARGYAVNISVASDITTLINTGTLTTTDNAYHDIINQGTLTNFYNDQGYATSDPVKFYWRPAY
jgi:hypothetical protein